MKNFGLNSSGYSLPVVVSVLLHGLALVAMIVVWPRTISPPTTVIPQNITARVVQFEREKPKPQAKRPAPKPKPKPKPVKKAEPKPKPKPVQKPPQPTKQAIALRKKREQEKKRLAELKKADEEAEKRRQEQLRREREQELQRTIAEEQRNQARASEQQRKDELTLASYQDAVAAVVSQNWTRPLSARRGMKVQLRIQLTPTGEVISIEKIKGSGDDAFDRSALHALQRAAPLRELQGMESRLFEQNFRTMNFVFDPQDLLE